ncbi:hypothetical protein [Dickeya ananatis]|uniref:hypothetical protein n=1 Tax=Dickeya ananatis TaxID=3061286 RepID=UPI00388EB214
MNIGWVLKKNSVINRFMITELEENDYPAEPDTLPDNVNYRFINGFVDVGVLPCRVRFLRETAPRAISLPESLRFHTLWSGGDDSQSVNFSDFWPCPAHVQRFARCYVHSDSLQAAPFLLSTCGGVTVWLNGEQICRFTPFSRNTEQQCELTLPLQLGLNTLVVHAEELCERDTDYLFSLRYVGERPLRWQVAPDAACSERMWALDRWLNSLSLVDNLTDGDVLALRADTPLTETVELHHHLLCNVNESVPPWQQQSTLAAGNTGWQVTLPDGLVGYYDVVCRVVCHGITLTRSLSFGRLPTQTMSMHTTPALSTLVARRDYLLRHIALHGFERIRSGAGRLCHRRRDRPYHACAQSGAA